MKRHAIVSLVLSGVLGWTAALAGTAPEQVAAGYLEAVRAKGFAAQADYLLPEEMERFREMLIPVFEAEQATGGRALLNATFGREATLLSVRMAEPADVVRRFSRVMAVRLPDQPTGFDELAVLGHVTEGETAHVLARLTTKAGEGVEERLEVVSLRPWRDGWRLLLSPRLETTLRGMAAPRDRAPAGPRIVPEPPEEPAQATPAGGR